MVEKCQENGIKIIVTTEKDAVKLKKFMDTVPETISALTLRIKILIIKGEDEFLERISGLL